jgi:hypothetical protein
MLKLFTGLRLYAAIVVIAGLVGAAAWLAHHERDIGRAEIRAEWAADKDQRQASALQAQQDAAAETSRRLAAQQKADHDHQTQLAAARADAAAASAVAGGLRNRIAQLAAGSGGTPSHPAPADVSTPAGGLGTVAGECAAAFAALADAARRGYLAGLDAASRYDALIPSTTERTTP